MIAANVVGGPGVGFDADDNELLVLWHGGQRRLPRAPKTALARALVDLIAERLEASAGKGAKVYSPG
jgi:phosphopantothenoylcysteine decarboxylase/phosphopantothenate--cysteine ligase